LPPCEECKICPTCLPCEVCPINKTPIPPTQLGLYIQRYVDNALKPVGDSDCHFITLFSLAITMRAKNILELGTRTGTTAIPLIFASSFTGGRVTSVDITEARFSEELKNLPPELSSRWTYNKSDAHAFLRNQTANLIWDLVFVDDWHARDHVKLELQLLAPHLNMNSVVLLHDLMAGTAPNYSYNIRVAEFANGGVYYGVVEFLKNSTELWEWATIPVCHGFTVLRKRDPQPK